MAKPVPKAAPADEGEPLESAEPVRTVRVVRGEQPTHSPLTPFQQFAWKTFRDRVTTRPPDPLLDEALLKAHMRIRGDEYLATVYATAVIVAAVMVVVGILLAIVLASSGQLPIGIFLAVALPILGGVGGFFVLKSLPGGKAKSRGKAIDRKISASMSFVSAMASADVNIDAIFKELARQKIYGEVADEAAWITRDTELLGVDILTAIRNGATRTPSKRFQDFLQGVVTTATSGGQLKPYFLAKADQYERENKLELLQRVETMGLLAETFVTVVVAFPLFLVIIIAIFAIIGGGGAFMITVLYGIILGMIPVSQIGFIFFMWSLAQEA
jgi:flagellar protein FlaJ